MANIGELKVGDKVRCKTKKFYNGVSANQKVINNYIFDVIQVGKPADRIVIGIKGVVTGPVHINTLTKVNPEAKTPVTQNTPSPAPKPKPKEDYNGLSGEGFTSDEIYEDAFPENKKEKQESKNEIIQKKEEKPKPNPNDKYKNKNQVMYGEERHSAKENNIGGGRINSSPSGKRYKKREHDNFIKMVEMNAPQIIQNGNDHPKIIGINTKPKSYEYDYSQDYENDRLGLYGLTVNHDKVIIDESMNLNHFQGRRRNLFIANNTYYNKFKYPHPNEDLTGTFAHVFFVRPDCNLLESTANPSNELKILPAVKNRSEYYYALKNSPELLRQLTQDKAGYDNEFMMYLSNKAETFDISDEYVNTDTYGAAYTGYKVAFGKDNSESKTAGKFSISYNDDRDLHVYRLHKLWTDYISHVYRGRFHPKKEYSWNKIIDYATCVYYILCAEDGETIIFWSKYWGVFPLDSPSSAFSYSSDAVRGIKKPSVKIEYQYSWKEDFNPLSLVEFNMHSKKDYNYVPNYNPDLLTVGNTWGGAPFIETINNGIDLPYTLKLRFRPGLYDRNLTW